MGRGGEGDQEVNFENYACMHQKVRSALLSDVLSRKGFESSVYIDDLIVLILLILFVSFLEQ